MIQVTGELAPRTSPITPLNQTPSTFASDSLSSLSTDPVPTPVSTEGDTISLTGSTQHVPYKPTQAEVLASHIYAFVSSASTLSAVLSNPSLEDTNNETEFEARSVSEGVNGNSEVRRMDDRSVEAKSDRENDDEVKLLRLRTKMHEILIIPDRKYLLCVVHDLSVGGPGGGPSHR